MIQARDVESTGEDSCTEVVGKGSYQVISRKKPQPGIWCCVRRGIARV